MAFAVVIAQAAPAPAAGVAPLWSHTEGDAVAVSPDGAVVYAAAGPSVVAFDSVTGAERWRTTTPSVGDPSIAVTPDGARVVVAGYATDTLGEYRRLEAYDAATGQVEWTVDGWSGRLTAMALSPDSATVYVTGNNFQSASRDDYLTEAFDATTGALRWRKRFDGPASLTDWPAALALSPDGLRLFVTGSSQGATSGEDYATVAYATPVGDPLWVRRYADPGSSLDHAVAIGVSPDGTRVFVTGTTGEQTAARDIVTISYGAPYGGTWWTKRYDGAGDIDLAGALAVAPDGARVYVVGTTRTPVSGFDIVTIAYGAAGGGTKWTQRYSSSSWGVEQGFAVAVTGSGAVGTVFVAGSGFFGVSTGKQDAVVTAYRASTGATSWSAHYDGPGHGSDLATGLVVSPTGTSVFASGVLQGASPSGVTLAYSAG